MITSWSSECAGTVCEPRGVRYMTAKTCRKRERSAEHSLPIGGHAMSILFCMTEPPSRKSQQSSRGSQRSPSHYLRHVATPLEPLAQCWQVGGGEQVICEKRYAVQDERCFLPVVGKIGSRRARRGGRWQARARCRLMALLWFAGVVLGTSHHPLYAGPPTVESGLDSRVRCLHFEVLGTAPRVRPPFSSPNERAMGQASSIASCKNDFELVIRATKELEWLLETHFGAPDGKNVGLHDKISAARDPRNQKPLPEKIIRRMRKLVTIRNALVHDRNVNAIPDRPDFVAGWQEVEARLQGDDAKEWFLVCNLLNTLV